MRSISLSGEAPADHAWRDPPHTRATEAVGYHPSALAVARHTLVVTHAVVAVAVVACLFGLWRRGEYVRRTGSVEAVTASFEERIERSIGPAASMWRYCRQHVPETALIYSVPPTQLAETRTQQAFRHGLFPRVVEDGPAPPLDPETPLPCPVYRLDLGFTLSTPVPTGSGSAWRLVHANGHGHALYMLKGPGGG